MVKIRLRRRGRKKAPIYDIVATDVRNPRDGRITERIGQFNPMRTPSYIDLNKERALYWLQVGAQPTDIARHILSIEGVMLHLHMIRKGKSEEEIAQALEAHKQNVATRAARVADKKAKKKSQKIVEAEKAKAEAAAEAAAVANADAEGDAPAEG